MPQSRHRKIPFWALGWIMLSALALACESEDERPFSLVEGVRIIGAQLARPDVSLPPDIYDHPLQLLDAIKLDVSGLIYAPDHANGVMDISVAACTELSELPGDCLEFLQYQTLGGDFVDANGELTELAWRDYLSAHTWRGQLTLNQHSGEFKASLNTFEGYGLFLQEEGSENFAAHLTILTCPEGLCPVFGTYDAYLDDEKALGGEAILKSMAIRENMALQGPLGQIAVAYKDYIITSRENYLNENPEIISLIVNGVETRENQPLVPLDGAQTTLEISVPTSSHQYLCQSSGTCGYEPISIMFLSSTGLVSPHQTTMSFKVEELQATWDVEAEGEAYLWAIVRDSRSGLSWAEVRAER